MHASALYSFSYIRSFINRFIAVFLTNIYTGNVSRHARYPTFALLLLTCVCHGSATGLVGYKMSGIPRAAGEIHGAVTRPTGNCRINGALFPLSPCPPTSLINARRATRCRCRRVLGEVCSFLDSTTSCWLQVPHAISHNESSLVNGPDAVPPTPFVRRAVSPRQRAIECDRD